VSSCPELLDHLAAEEHVVQLYGQDDRLLTRNVGRYLDEGLKRGDGLLVIGTPEHRSSFVRYLGGQPRYSKAVLEGRLVFLDAATTLGRFMVDGLPDAALFDAVVGESLRHVRANAGHTGVRAYGEMVGLLWVSGNSAAASRLEELWNELLRSSNIRLFCAYPIDVFSSDFDVESIDAVLASHTHLLPVDPALQEALARAMDEVLGPGAVDIRDRFRPNHPPSWAAIPRPESMVLWLRHNLPDSAKDILDRARGYYEPLAYE
jgi:MEDS: MEthanogen/methylotroph, DcmR Sensory domain